MARFKCTNCEGTYSDVDSTGATYFHACPAGRIFTGHGYVEYPARDRRDENVKADGSIKALGRGRVRSIASAVDTA